MITGFCKEEIIPGDKMHIQGNDYTVKEVVERRDHAGEFLDPEDKKGSFFKVNCSFERVVETSN